MDAPLALPSSVCGLGWISGLAGRTALNQHYKYLTENLELSLVQWWSKVNQLLYFYSFRVQRLNKNIQDLLGLHGIILNLELLSISFVCQIVFRRVYSHHKTKIKCVLFHVDYELFLRTFGIYLSIITGNHINIFRTDSKRAKNVLLWRLQIYLKSNWSSKCWLCSDPMKHYEYVSFIITHHHASRISEEFLLEKWAFEALWIRFALTHGHVFA